MRIDANSTVNGSKWSLKPSIRQIQSQKRLKTQRDTVSIFENIRNKKQNSVNYDKFSDIDKMMMPSTLSTKKTHYRNNHDVYKEMSRAEMEIEYVN